MRRNRVKPVGIPLFYHLYNRVAGEPGHTPFGPVEKEKFIRILHRLQKFFTVEVIAYQVMSNHFHLLVYVPEDLPSKDEVMRRYSAYYGGKSTLKADDPMCAIMATRMRDVSWFMHALQQQFSTWYNRSRAAPRRGPLWAQRFKHTLLGEADAVWACWKYIEMNPVRAGMVRNPADHRFSSYGAWAGRGQHPFAGNVARRALRFLHPIYPLRSMEQLFDMMQRAFTEHGTGHPHDRGNLADAITVLDRRTRYWIDGLIIGTHVFLRDIIARSNGMIEERSAYTPLDERGNQVWAYTR